MGYTTDERQMGRMKLLAIDTIMKSIYFVPTTILSVFAYTIVLINYNISGDS